MLTKKTRQHLHVSKAFRPPPIGPPPFFQVISALRNPPSRRTQEDIQIIFRYLLMNEKLLKMLENSERVETAAKEAQYIQLHKGDILFFEGDVPDGWFLVLDGAVDIIIRLFLIAEDCFLDTDTTETTEFAQLMDQMELDATIDKLTRVGTMTEGMFFGQRAYLLDRRRSATIICATEQCDLIKFSPGLFQQTSSLILAKKIYEECSQLTHAALPRLREDQLTLICSLSEIIKVKENVKITQDKPLGRYLIIVKSGTLAQYRVIDFTDLSFRKLDAAFEDLELHFPDGLHPVHTNDLSAGALFADPSLDEMIDQQFIVKTTTDVELVLIDLDYFKIVAGHIEIEKIKQELKSVLTDQDVIDIWINAEKANLWGKFRKSELKESHKEIKTELQFKNSTLAIRVPKNPKSMKPFRPRHVVPYASKSLRK